ncbi:MAG: GDP-mannose 4,6-dehydratase [Candidatus Levybacteria bacterium]|nr:GDP-mannose 4,6-dehydratase [Candidatus Levybacteria bacterium]
MPKALVTGINGFVGTHLNNYLLSKGYEVFGTLKPSHESTQDSHSFAVDILDYEGLKKVVDEVSPDFIYHLAALTSPAASFNNPSETITNNIGGQVNILEAVKELKLMNTRVLVVSSAEVYGQVSEKDLPIDEETPLKPTSPYAVSKIAQDFLGLQYFLSQNIQCVRVRPFNHSGPYQSPFFAIPAFAKQIAEIEVGKQEPIMKVGNLDAKKDFTDARDIVRAYELLMEKGENGEVYNIGSGKSYKISEVLDMLLSYSKEQIIVEKDQSLMRPIEIPELVCDYSKLHHITGWKPEISIETSLRDTLDYWRNIV